MQCCKCRCKYPVFFRIRGAVIVRIWLEVIICSLYAALTVYIQQTYTSTRFIELPQSIFSVIGVATGMLLVFRTNTSYDRFWEGRKLWSDLTSNIRTLMRVFWVMVEDREDSKIIVEKLSAVNLLVSFAYSVKHYLREEYSYEEDDLLVFTGHLPHLLTPTATVTLRAQEEVTIALAAKIKAEKRISQETNKLTMLKKSIRKMRRQSTGMPLSSEELAAQIGSNIPLEISLYISSYVKSCKDRNFLDSPTARVVDGAISRMVDCLTSFERIRRTPIPLAYLAHLTHVTWIVLLMLPFHLNRELSYTYISVPVMALVSFAMLGILGIGKEIEDPFGYDFNDLNLDDYCRILHKEAIAITAQPLPKPETWMFSEENHPVVGNRHLNAAELITYSPAELNKILFMGRGYTFSDKPKAKARASLQESQKLAITSSLQEIEISTEKQNKPKSKSKQNVQFKKASPPP